MGFLRHTPFPVSLFRTSERRRRCGRVGDYTTYADGRGPWRPRIVPLARSLRWPAEPMRLGLVVHSPTSPPEARLRGRHLPLHPVLFPLAESHVCGANLTGLPCHAAGRRKAGGQAAKRRPRVVHHARRALPPCRSRGVLRFPPGPPWGSRGTEVRPPAWGDRTAQVGWGAARRRAATPGLGRGRQGSPGELGRRRCRWPHLAQGATEPSLNVFF